MKIKKAVFSFLPLLKSGACAPWWDDFPRAITKCLNRKNIDHFCWYWDHTDKSPYSLRERYKISWEQIKNPYAVKRIVTPYLKDYSEIVFHAHNFSCNGLRALGNKFTKNYHWVITDHDLWETHKISQVKTFIRCFLRKIGFLPEEIIGTSKASKKHLEELYGANGVYFVYNGLKIPDLNPPVALSTKPVRALFVGRLEEYKGLWPLLEAIQLAKEKIDVHLTIVGNGPLYDSLKIYIIKHGLEKHIALAGRSTNVSTFYNQSDFVIIPTTCEESFCLVSLEAQAHYLPAIYTNSGGMPENQIDGKTGIMVPKNDPRAIVDGIQYFQEDIDRFNQMRLWARENSLNFSIERMAEGYVDFYLTLFGDRTENFSK